MRACCFYRITTKWQRGRISLYLSINPLLNVRLRYGVYNTYTFATLLQLIDAQELIAVGHCM